MSEQEKEQKPVIDARTIATPMPPVPERLIQRRQGNIGANDMSDLQKPTPTEARLLDPEIVDIAIQRQAMAQAIGQQIIDGPVALPEQQTIQPATWRDVLVQGGAAGLSGADGSGNDPEMMQDYLDRINGEEQ